MTRPSFGQPALIGGLAMGVLSALPIIAAGNLCCCLWVITGGAVAAYMLQANYAAPITAADGLLVGLLAGVIGAAVHTVLAIPISLIFGPAERAMVERFIEMAPPEAREIFDRVGVQNREVGSAFFIVGHIVGFIFWSVIGAIFSSIGGVLGATVFKKSSLPPPGTIDVPPQT